MHISYSSNPDGSQFRALMDRLDVESTPVMGPCLLSQTAFLIQDHAGTVLGGLWAHVAYRWLTIDLLFIPRDLRRQGLGSALVRKAEDVARIRGCLGMQVMTFAFQAPDFYGRFGFEVFNIQVEPATKQVQHHFIKELRASADA